MRRSLKEPLSTAEQEVVERRLLAPHAWSKSQILVADPQSRPAEGDVRADLLGDQHAHGLLSRWRVLKNREHMRQMKTCDQYAEVAANVLNQALCRIHEPVTRIRMGYPAGSE